VTPLEAQKAKNRILSGVRSFFDQKGFLEVQTPLLSPGVIPESSIEVFRTELVHPNHPPQPLFLLPSPELWMKRLLAQGFPSLWQISRAFRNAESLGRWHNPEFSMLEWYALGMDYQDNIALTLELLRSLADPKAFPDWFQEPLVISVRQAFQRWAGVDLDQAEDFSSLNKAAEAQGHHYPSAETWEELFHFLLVEKIEAGFPEDRLVFLTDYPIQVPTTAKALSGSPYLQRWEVYYQGVELANCYTEENDPQRLRPLMEAEIQSKSEALVPATMDEEFLQAIERMPACSGVALGLDRLIALLLGQKRHQGGD
jgi:lysyl-tRNA synthetase class 2